MENNKKLIVILAVFVVVLVGAGLLYSRLAPQFTQDPLATVETQPQETTGSTQPQQFQVPDFTVYDAQGNAVHLSDYFGKPIVLNFWASWCGPCQREMPDFEEKYQALGNDIQFLMVNMTDGNRETMETASNFIAQKGYSFPVFYDTQLQAAMTYGAYSLPMTFFIDSHGNLITHAVGAINSKTLQRGIDMIS